MSARVKISGLIQALVFAICLFQHADGNSMFFRIDVLTTVLLAVALAITARNTIQFGILVIVCICYPLVWNNYQDDSFYPLSDCLDLMLMIGVFIGTPKNILSLGMLVKVGLNVLVGFSDNYTFNPSELFDIVSVLGIASYVDSVKKQQVKEN